jgi:hypothetical protein
MKRKILSSILVAIMVFSCMMITDVSFVSASTASVANESQLRTAIGQAGSSPVTITLTADIELISNFTLPAGANVTLRSSDGNDGNAFSLIATRNMDVVTIPQNASLTIENVSIARVNGTIGRGVNNSGNFTMRGGSISGHSLDRGGRGCGVLNSGTFVMYNAIIGYNTIYGSWDRVGGTPFNSSWLSGSGGGVFNSGIFNMTDSTILGNLIVGRGGGGGGVQNSGAFTMRGGTISFNAVDDTIDPSFHR